MLLYIHVPFCHKKCYYCAFYSQPIKTSTTSGQQQIHNYLTTLKQELSYWSQKLLTPSIESIYFGGGTPSILTPQTVYDLLQYISYHYKIHTTIEITLEANPESLQNISVNKEYLDSGINRFSLGFQSLKNEQLLKMGRIHKAMDALNAYTMLREALCTNVNIDLIWGLPNQTLHQWTTTLQKIIELKPNHISTYGLTLEPGTLFKQQYTEHIYKLPSEEEQVDMFFATQQRLEQAEFIQYEISNFSLRGYQCKHNNGYWERKDYLGVGPSATSTMHPYRWTNPKSLSRWASLIKEGKEAAKEYIDPYTSLLELIMLRLRTTQGLQLQHYKALTGKTFITEYKTLIVELQQKKLAYIHNGYLKLTGTGMLISDSILQQFFKMTPHVL